jgi:DNA-binding MarR family transcriptional regulator
VAEPPNPENPVAPETDAIAAIAAATEQRGNKLPDPGGLGEVAEAWTIGGPNFLPYRVLLLARMLDRLTARLLHDNAGITVAEWRVLVQLASTAPATVRDLAGRLWVDRAEVSRAAASLERRHFVERRDNPADGRSTLFSLSPQGWTLYERVWPLRMEFHTALSSRLDRRQRDALEQALMVLAQDCVDRMAAAETGKPSSE